jgi:exodeoxyribonuclease-5
MERPILALKQIHRQAKKNPIIALSIHVREGGHVEPGEYGPGVRKYRMDDPEGQEALSELLSSYSPETLILCGYNSTRRKLNTYIRNILGFNSSLPCAGDRVICLRNNHKAQIFNGMLGTIESIEPHTQTTYMASIAFDDESRLYQGVISASQFEAQTTLNITPSRNSVNREDLFDFGYAITVHKAQGSQAKRVIVIEERFPKMTDTDWVAWLYTAVTRAQEELYLFSRK